MLAAPAPAKPAPPLLSLRQAYGSYAHRKGLEDRRAELRRRRGAAQVGSRRDLHRVLDRLDGLELTRRLRGDDNKIPILMLTARDQVSDRVAGLEAGADDYLVKPFALEELVARVRALLRRLGTDDEPTTLSFADLELNTGTREVIRGDDELALTRTEFALLELFLRNPRQVLTRSVIFDRVWGYDFGYGSNSLDVYISYLRKKTEAGGKPRLIHTVRGVGYALREP